MIIGSDDKPQPNFSSKIVKNEKGKYFIAKINKIVNINKLLIETKGMGDEQLRNHQSEIIFPIIPKERNKYWDEKRYAIYFEEASEIQSLSTNDFRVPQNPVLYIKANNYEDFKTPSETFLELVSLNLSKIIESNKILEIEQKILIQEIENKFQNLLTDKIIFEINPLHVNRKIYDKHTFFQRIYIEKSKKLSNFKIENLKQFNIFKGSSNSGKTTILESIFWLGKQNDIQSFIDSWRIRGKSDLINPFWLLNELNHKIIISGEVNNQDISINIEKVLNQQTKSKEKNYLNDILIKAEYNKVQNHSSATFYSNQNCKVEFGNLNPIFNTHFTSSLRLQNKKNFLNCIDKTLKNNILSEIAQFINQNIDSKIENIEIINDEKGQFFLVKLKNLQKIDLSSFGESLQKIVYLSTFLATAQNGNLIIDDFENYFDNKILLTFSDLIIKYCLKFNIQLFITTKNEECIKAFSENILTKTLISVYELNDNKLELMIND